MPSESLAGQDNQVADALQRINGLSAAEIDQKIQTIKTFVEETTDGLKAQIRQVELEYARQIALLEAARVTLKTLDAPA